MTAAASPWAGLYAPAGKPDLRDTSTQSAAGKKARTAFDIPAGTTSAVTLAVKPRQAAYRAGPGIHVVGWQCPRPPRCRDAPRDAANKDLRAMPARQFLQAKKSPVGKTGTLPFTKGS